MVQTEVMEVLSRFPSMKTIHTYYLPFTSTLKVVEGVRLAVTVNPDAGARVGMAVRATNGKTVLVVFGSFNE